MNWLVLLFTTLLLTCSVSCHKRHKNDCNGQFRSVLPVGTASGGYPVFNLCAVDENTAQITGYSDIQFNEYVGGGIYDPGTNKFYLFTASYRSSTGIRLMCYDLADGTMSTVGTSLALDTVSQGYWDDYELAFNGTTKKLYCVTHSSSVDRLYEIDFAGGAYTEREIYAADQRNVISSPVVDDITGWVYFVSGTALKKVEPHSGASAIAADLHGMTVDELQFNGLSNIYAVNTSKTPYHFIRIDVGTGAISDISELPDFNRNASHTFDYCRNQYILRLGRDIYWIDLGSGKTVKHLADYDWDSMVYVKK